MLLGDCLLVGCVCCCRLMLCVSCCCFGVCLLRLLLVVARVVDCRYLRVRCCSLMCSVCSLFVNWLCIVLLVAWCCLVLLLWWFVFGGCVMLFCVCLLIIVFVWCRCFDDVLCNVLLCVVCWLLIDVGCCVVCLWMRVVVWSLVVALCG